MAITSITKLVNANTSKSLRVTIPAHIVEVLELEQGDSIKWYLVAKGRDKFGIDVQVLKK